MHLGSRVPHVRPVVACIPVPLPPPADARPWLSLIWENFFVAFFSSQTTTRWTQSLTSVMKCFLVDIILGKRKTGGDGGRKERARGVGGEAGRAVRVAGPTAVRARLTTTCTTNPPSSTHPFTAGSLARTHVVRTYVQKDAKNISLETVTMWLGEG